MNRSVSVVLRLVGLVAVVAVLGWVGCSGDEQLDFDCETHDECLDGEACLAETCVDEPVEGQSCPDEHEGEEYEDIRCENGEWERFEFPDPPTIQAVDAEPPTVDPGEVVELDVEVDVSPETEDDLEYQWTAPEGWGLVADDQPSVAMVAHEEWGQTATVEVVVTDRFDQSDSGDVTTSTHEADGPEINAVEADPNPVLPDEVQTVEVDAEHPQELELDYHWVIPDDWQDQSEDDAEHGEHIDLKAPDEHDVSESIEVVVTDVDDREATAATTLSTRPNPGPSIDAMTFDDNVLEPGEAMEVSVVASHELDYEITDYSWMIAGSGWSTAQLDEETEVEVQAPDEHGSDGQLTLEISDEFGGATERELPFFTEPEENSPPEIDDFYLDDNPIDAEESTQAHLEVSDEFGEEALGYDWSVASVDDWEVEASDDGLSADVEAPEEFGSTADVYVEVTDPAGESNDATLEIGTKTESNEPPVVELSVDQAELDPAGSTYLEAQAYDPYGLDLDYHWDVEDGDWELDETGDETVVELAAPDAADVETDVSVTVEDEQDESTTASANVATVETQGPEIDAVEVDGEGVVPPGATTTVEVEAHHPQGFDFDYEWTLKDDNSDEGWEIIDGGDEEVVTIEAPDETDTHVFAEVTAVDAYGGEDIDDAFLETEENDGPQIDDGLWAEDNPVAPNETTEVHMDVEHPQGHELSYDWDVDDEQDGWDIQGDDTPVTLTPAHEPDVNSVVEVTVSDPYGEEVDETLVVDTKQNQDPDLEATEPAEDELMPADSTTVTVDVEHPFEFAMDYDWNIDGEGWSITGGEGTETIDVAAPDETDSVAQIDVTVTDDYDGWAEDSTLIGTVENPGPEIVELDGVPEDEIDPGETRTVTAEVTHELGFDLDYDWELDNDDWTVVDEDDETLEVESPEEPNSELTVTYTVTDDYDGEDQQSGTLATIDNDPPQITSAAATPSPPYELGEDFNLDGDAYDPDGGPVYYEWTTDGDWDIDSPDSSFTAAWAPDQTELEDIDLVVTDQWGYTDTETVEVRTYDYAPAPFGFTDQDEVAPNTWVESEQVEMEDFEEPVDAECFGCEVRKNDGTYQPTVDDVEPGDDLQVRVESATYDDSVSAHVEVGETESDEWTVETRSWEGERVFTTCGLEEGATGPSQAECDEAYDWPLDEEVDLDDGIQEWTVPADGTYEIEALGAGDDDAAGAMLEGEVDLEAGTELLILVGQQGAGTRTPGHGGTFVADGDGLDPVIVAGGASSEDGRAETSGGDAESSNTDAEGDGGSGGDGGEDAYEYNIGEGGGGGGFDTDGTGNSRYSGEAFVNGGEGGQYDDPHGHDAFGGFGGGGGSHTWSHSDFCRRAAGGGGGYSGGGGAWGSTYDGCPDVVEGGGGGSYMASGVDELFRAGGINGGPGQVTIDLVELD